MSQISISEEHITNPHYVFIFNPISGTKSKTAVESYIHQFFKDLSYELFKTEYPGNATEISANYSHNSNNVLVAVGGDGTINEIAQSLVNNPAKLGIIPTGSGNGFAGHTFKTKSLIECIQNLINIRIAKCDVLLINNQVCCNTCGIGLSGYVAKIFNEEGNRGLLNYLKLGLGKFKSFDTFDFLLNFESQNNILNLELANSSQLGNNAYVSPNSSIQDGLVELVLLKKPSILQLPSLIYDVFNKTLHNNNLVKIISSSVGQVELRVENHFHIDGEYKGLIKNIDFEILPSAINILI